MSFSVQIHPREQHEMNKRAVFVHFVLSDCADPQDNILVRLMKSSTERRSGRRSNTGLSVLTARPFSFAAAIMGLRELRRVLRR